MESLQVTYNDNNVLQYTVGYSTEQQICTGTGTLKIVFNNSIPYDITPWDKIVIFVGGDKIGTYYVSNIEKSVLENTITANCQDNSKRLVDYFILDSYTLDYLSHSRYWIEKFLDEVGLDYTITASGKGTPLSMNTSLGLNNAYDTVVTLLQQSGWYMYFDVDGKAIIGNLIKSSDSYDYAFNDSQILQYEETKDDKMLRNWAVVWGSSDPITQDYVYAETHINTPWNYDSDDKRAIVLSNSGIGTQGLAEEMAKKLTDEFAKITVTRKYVIAGYSGVSIGDMMYTDSKYYKGVQQVTSIGSSVSADGLITNITTGERCPRLWAFFFTGTGDPAFDDYVYIGTWGDGIKRKQLSGTTWEDFSTGLGSLYIKDLFINNGLFVCVTDDGYAYHRSIANSSWIRYNHGILVADEGKAFTEEEIRAKACSMDKTTDTFVIGYTLSGVSLIIASSGLGSYSGAESRSWVTRIASDGSLISNNLVNVSSSYNHELVDIESVVTTKDVVSTKTPWSTTFPREVTYGLGLAESLGTKTANHEQSSWGPYLPEQSIPAPDIEAIIPASGLSVMPFEDTLYQSLRGYVVDGYLLHYIKSLYFNTLNMETGNHSKFIINANGSEYFMKSSATTFEIMTYSKSGSVEKDIITFRHYQLNYTTHALTLIDTKIFEFEPGSEFGYRYGTGTYGNIFYCYYESPYESDSWSVMYCHIPTDTWSEGGPYNSDRIAWSNDAIHFCNYVWTADEYPVTSAHWDIEIDSVNTTTGALTATSHLLWTEPNPSSYCYIHAGGSSAKSPSAGMLLIDEDQWIFRHNFYMLVGIPTPNCDFGNVVHTSKAVVVSYGIPFGGSYPPNTVGDGAGDNYYNMDLPTYATYGDPIKMVQWSSPTYRRFANIYTSAAPLIGVDLEDYVVAGESWYCLVNNYDDDNNYYSQVREYDSGTKIKLVSWDTSTGEKIHNYELPGNVLTVSNASLVGNHLIADGLRHLQVWNTAWKKTFYDNGWIVSGDILRHGPDSDYFRHVYHMDDESRVETSKDTPTIVYSPPSSFIVKADNIDYSGYYSRLFGGDAITVHDAKIFDILDNDLFTVVSGSAYTSFLDRYIGIAGDNGVYYANFTGGELGTIVSTSGSVGAVEFSNYANLNGINPYIFYSISGSPPKFFQRNPDTSTFIDYSATLPTSNVTIIRLDDRI